MARSVNKGDGPGRRGHCGAKTFPKMAAGARGRGGAWLVGLPLSVARGGGRAGLAAPTGTHGRGAGARRGREGEGNPGAARRGGVGERGAGGRLARTRLPELGDARPGARVGSPATGGLETITVSPPPQYFLFYCHNRSDYNQGEGRAHQYCY